MCVEGPGVFSGCNRRDFVVSVTRGPLACEPWRADARAVQALAVAGASVQTADISAGVLVRLTVCSCGGGER